MYKLPYTGAEIEERLAKLDDLNAENFLLSTETADLYGLSGVDANVDNALLKLTPRMRYKVFKTSGTFIVPEGVTQIKVSGCASGGSPNAGGYIIDVLNTVSPGQSLTIICGSGNTTISEIGITLVANSVSANIPNTKFGILPSLTNAQWGSPTAFNSVPLPLYPELWEDYNSNGVGGAPAGSSYKPGKAGGMYSGGIGGAGTEKAGVLYTSGQTIGSTNIGGYAGAFGAGGACGTDFNGGGGGGGYGAGGGVGGYGNLVGSGTGSKGFILIEW